MADTIDILTEEQTALINTSSRASAGAGWRAVLIIVSPTAPPHSNVNKIQQMNKLGPGWCDITWLNSVFSSEALVCTGGMQPGLAGFHDY